MDRRVAETAANASSALPSGQPLSMNDLTSRIIGAAIEVHRQLGPGLLESTYRACLCRELSLQGIAFTTERPLCLNYKGIALDCGYRIDVCVEERVVLELKSVEELKPLHTAQLLTYLKLSGMSVGLLMNFNVSVMKDGIRRVVNNFDETPSASSAPPR
jgi:GxxExxY protein